MTEKLKFIIKDIIENNDVEIIKYYKHTKLKLSSEINEDNIEINEDNIENYTDEICNDIIYNSYKKIYFHRDDLLCRVCLNDSLDDLIEFIEFYKTYDESIFTKISNYIDSPFPTILEENNNMDMFVYLFKFYENNYNDTLQKICDNIGMIPHLNDIYILKYVLNYINKYNISIFDSNNRIDTYFITNINSICDFDYHINGYIVLDKIFKHFDKCEYLLTNKKIVKIITRFMRDETCEYIKFAILKSKYRDQIAKYIPNMKKDINNYNILMSENTNIKSAIE